MRRLGLALVCFLGLACAGAPPRGAVLTTPAGNGVVARPADCSKIAAPHLAELCAMDEPSLSLAGQETYRFLWMRHLHNPVAVRVTRRGAGIAVVSVEANTQNPRDARRHEFVTDLRPWTAFLAHVDAAHFWNLAGDPTDDERGLDGADWVLEGRRGGVYHSVIRWNPPPGPFRAACEDLINLSGLSFPAELR